MQAINRIIPNLQEQIWQFDATAPSSGQQLATAIETAYALVLETKAAAKSLNNNQLLDFFNANVVMLSQLHIVAQNPNPDNPLLAKSTAIMQQLSIMYQDIIVPMLTRLHNLSPESDNMQKITAITSLGNEIITFSAQINQFSDKFTLQEKIIAIFGILLMLSSISMMVTILTKDSVDMSMFTALSIVALGCCICRKAMQAHASDPGTDLITTSVKKMEPLICDIAKDNPHEQQQLKQILMGSASAKITETPIPVPKRQATPAHKPVQTIEETTPEPSQETEPNEEASQGTIMGKLKGMFDLFQPKK